MLKVQKFLNNRTLEDLRKDPFNLHISAEDDLILLKYNQFDSDFTQKIVNECRGIILEKNTWNIVCHPFHKFYNFGETYAYNIRLDESYVFEKVDGSIIKVYYNNNEWCIATNGTIDAKNALSADAIPFDTLFFDVISKEDFKKVTDKFDVKNTYLFELIHPMTRIVVDYGNKKELVFLGMIGNKAEEKGDIIDYDILSIRKKMEKIFKNFPIRYPRVFDLDNINDINELSNIADEENHEGNEFEGFVVVEVFNKKVIGRVKIKSPKYINLHHIATGESVTNNLIIVLVNNEIKEFEVYLEKLPNSVASEYNSLKKKYFKLIKYLYVKGEKYREKAKEITRKELALDIQTHIKRQYNGFIFKMVDNSDITPEELLKNFGIKKIKSLLS